LALEAYSIKKKSLIFLT